MPPNPMFLERAQKKGSLRRLPFPNQNIFENTLWFDEIPKGLSALRIVVLGADPVHAAGSFGRLDELRRHHILPALRAGFVVIGDFAIGQAGARRL